MGWNSHDAIVKLLHKSHIFVLPSITAQNGTEEGIANALKEAMLSGLPVVTTYHGGNIELIDDRTGLLVPQRDVDLLVKSIECLITQPEKRRTFGRAGRKKVLKMFDSKKLNQQLEHLLLGLLQY